MKLTSSLIFLIVLVASGFCDTTPTTSTETTTTSIETTTVADTTTVSTTSQQPDTTTTTVSTTTVSTTSRQPDTTTTTVSTTTNPPTTASTVPPTTPSTTAKPTTPLPDTTTTPKPTTVSPATTTKSPEPPIPVEGSWNVTEGNLTCIRADLKIRFKISLKDKVEYIVLSPNATSSGNCKLLDNHQELKLEESEYTLEMIFEKDSNNAYLRNITFTYTLPDGAGMVYNDTKLFTVRLGNSYMCDSTDNINFKNVTMEVFRIHVQSFGTVGNKDFGTAEECEADNQVNDMVPIAVGIVLLVLVVVVLVAYFIGRRRSRQKGYQSV